MDTTLTGNDKRKKAPRTKTWRFRIKRRFLLAQFVAGLGAAMPAASFKAENHIVRPACWSGQRNVIIMSIDVFDRARGTPKIMDIAQIRTFLEVANTRHFGRAADQLNITQSTVSARIKLLESTLGVQLFERQRNNIQLTAAGERLSRHAQTIVQAWSRARSEVAVDSEAAQLFGIGATSEAWDVLGTDWLRTCGEALPGIALTLESHTLAVLQQRLLSNLLDLVVCFDVPPDRGLEVIELGVVPIRLYASRSGLDLDSAVSGNYLLVDWGPMFARWHADQFDARARPSLRANRGNLARMALDTRGGAAYLPEYSALSDGLYAVADAPVFERRLHGLLRGGDAREERVREITGMMHTRR